MEDHQSIAKLKSNHDEIIASKTLTQKALHSIWRDKLTLVALSYIAILTVISLLAPFITDRYHASGPQ